jgi:type I restriction enzyme S subunit
MMEGYKESELGLIPEDWDALSLGNVFKMKSGEGITKDSGVHGEYPVYGGNGVTFFHNKYRYEHPQIIIGRVGAYCGCIHKTEAKSWITDNALIIHEKIINYDDDFLFFILTYLELNNYANKNAQPVISGQKIYPLIIPFPSISEQQKIAAILSTVDDKMDVIEEKIKETQQLKQSLMQTLLTKGIGHTKFKASPLGEIPESWEVSSIDDACQIHNNLRKPISSEERRKIKGTYPYYGPTGIVDYIDSYLIDGQYVLIGEDGDHFLKYNRWPMTQLISGKANVNNHAHVLKGKGNCSTEWVYWYFKHRDIIRHLTRQGAGRYKLTKATLLTLKMVIPSQIEQAKIISIFFSIEEKLSILQEKKSEYTQLKKGLMQQLLTGKIRVNHLVNE